MWCRWVQRIQKQTLDSTLDEKTWKNELWSVNQWWHLFGTALCTSKFTCLQCMTSWQPGIYSPLGANWSCWCQRSRFVTVTWLRTRRGRPLWALFRWLCSDVKICQVRCLLDLSYWNFDMQAEQNRHTMAFDVQFYDTECWEAIYRFEVLMSVSKCWLS